MGMSWDFTNYTFSFLVSLIGTILGTWYLLSFVFGEYKED